MEDDLMSDAPMEQAPAPEPQEEDQKAARTALLPLDFFEGKEVAPGTECKVRVEAVQEDQVEVSYVPHTEEEPVEEAEYPAEEPDELMA